MIIGVPREVKDNEFRVSLTPSGADELVRNGHTVIIESNAGTASGFSDESYREAGAEVTDSADTVWKRADVVVKVKEPQASEYSLMRKGQVLFTYLHLAADPECAAALLDKGVTGVAYETVTGPRGLPLLAPMSEVAGRLATQVGAYHLMRPIGGSGMLVGGVPGTRPAKVVIIGGGIVGENSASMARGLGADVTVIDVNIDRLRALSSTYGHGLKTLASNAMTISAEVAAADLVIGSVLVPGAAAPKLVTRETIDQMRPGSVLVDIAIDQGGCFEGSHPTTHSDPTFTVDGKVYYCVANMPGAVPQTSTVALTNATLPHLLNIANHGVLEAMRSDAHLANGLNVFEGSVTHPAVAQALNVGPRPLQDVLNSR